MMHGSYIMCYMDMASGIAGDTLQPFSAGDVALIPPSMHHYWEYTPSSTDTDGCIHYLMVAFSHTFVLKCIEVFPELRNRLAGLTFPVNALKFGLKVLESFAKYYWK